MLPILKQELVDEPPCVLSVTANKLDVVIEVENDIIKRVQIDDDEPGFTGVKMEPVDEIVDGMHHDVEMVKRVCMGCFYFYTHAQDQPILSKVKQEETVDVRHAIDHEMVYLFLSSNCFT